MQKYDGITQSTMTFLVIEVRRVHLDVVQRLNIFSRDLSNVNFQL